MTQEEMHEKRCQMDSARARGISWPYWHRKAGASARVSRVPYGAGSFQRNRNGLWIR